MLTAQGQFEHRPGTNGNSGVLGMQLLRSDARMLYMTIQLVMNSKLG